MSLLREIQNDLATPDAEVTSILRKCKILAARLGSDELARWVAWELDGYPESQPTPDYRHLHGACYANFMNIAWRADNQPVVWDVAPEEVREKARNAFQNVDFREGIAKVTSFVDEGARINRSDLGLLLQGKMYPEMDCVGAWLEIPSSEFKQLISAIKNRILDFVLKIEAENPDAGEAPLNTQPVSREKLYPLVQNTFYGPVGNVAQNSEHFSQTGNMGIQPQDLHRLVTDFTGHLDELNLDERQKERARAQIAALKAELAGEPDPGIVKQAGFTLWNITQGAIGSLLATAAQPTVWHWIHQTLAALSKT